MPRSLAGVRLDRVVALMTGRSRTDAAGLVDSRAVAVSGRAVEQRSHRVVEGDVIEVDLPDVIADDGLVADADVSLTVVHEDADVVVINKPPGLVVHPGAGQSVGTLVHGLLARYPEIRSLGDPARPGIVHRLDKGTSGLLVVARTAVAYEGLVSMLAARQVDRLYRALVWDELESPTGMIDAPIGRSARDRTRMAVTASGKPARTRFSVVRTFHDPVTVTELQCALETGRTHQIRVHLASVGNAVVGDARYGGGRASLPVERPFLHAERLGFEHPVSGARLDLEAPLPGDLAAVLDRLS